MAYSEEHLTTGFKIRTFILLSIIYLSAIINTLFLALVNVVYKGEDNRVNSFFGLLFMFTPAVCSVVFILVLLLQALIDEGPKLSKPFGTLYIFALLSSMLQFCLICKFAGTTKENDSAYLGLIERQVFDKSE